MGDHGGQRNALTGELYIPGCAGESSRTLSGGRRLGWVITGGESGPGARPAHPDWFRSIRDQCAAAGVPFFFKQWGEWLPAEDIPSEAQESLELQNRDGYAGGEDNLALLYRVGKKAAGRQLDGVIWDQVPEVA